MTDATIHLLSSLADIDRDTWDTIANPGWRLAPGGALEKIQDTPLNHSLNESNSSSKINNSHSIPESNREAAESPREDVAETSVATAKTLANAGEQGSEGQAESLHEERESISQKPALGDSFPFNPFLSHDFLWSLEEAGCATPQTGWAACHLVLEGVDGKPTGLLPGYLKSHSQGEYVFDHGWADAFERAGGRYYPKYQSSIPFTPATTRKLLVRPGPDADRRRRALAAGVIAATERLGASSAHLTFLENAERDLLVDEGFLHRTDQQFHWFNEGFATFDDFLATLASRKRKTIRRERREAAQSDLSVRWVTGDDITEDHWDAFYGFYMDTGSRKWGSPYLNRLFFSLIGERMAKRILLIMAYRGDEPIAGALNFIGSDTLYGRNWGTIDPMPFLHFEICYYQAIDFAIANGLARVEAGAQGPHKLARGYRPVTTHSAHWIVHPGLRDAVEHYLTHERAAVEEENSTLEAMTPFKKA